MIASNYLDIRPSVKSFKFGEGKSCEVEVRFSMKLSTYAGLSQIKRYWIVVLCNWQK